MYPMRILNTVMQMSREKEIDPLESLPKVPTFDLKVQQPEATETCMSDTEVQEIMILQTQLKKLLGQDQS